MAWYTKFFYHISFCLVAMIVSLSLYRKPGVSAQKCSDLNPDIDLKAEWWCIPPYASRQAGSMQNGTNIEGIFPELFEELVNRTGIKIKYGEPFPNYSNFSKTVGNNDTLFFPIMKQEDDEEECFIPVMKTFGPAYLIRIEKIVPLTLLGKGLLQGWQVIALTIVLAAISGIFMWLMDRSTNPVDFPPSFFPGVWQGFWWAFVTMTTVGYGDTAPRSIPARLYSILWMIIGMIAFSVLTANITSSLSHQTFDAEERLFGKRVGVLEGTMDAKAALMENANVLNYDTVTELLSGMKGGHVDGILMERYVAGAYYNTYKEQGLELGTMLLFPYYFGFQAPKNIPGSVSSCRILKKCVQEILKENEIVTRALTELAKGWNSFKKADSTSLFEDQSFFFILIAFFFASLGVGGLWHYFVFIPKQRQMEVKEGNVEAGTNEEQEKLILLRKELELLCHGCCHKVEDLLKENPDRTVQDSAFPFPFPIAAPNLKRLSTNAFGQLRNMPSNAVGQLPGFMGLKKYGRDSSNGNE